MRRGRGEREQRFGMVIRLAFELVREARVGSLQSPGPMAPHSPGHSSSSYHHSPLPYQNRVLVLKVV